jgi:hypothetical protein
VDEKGIESTFDLQRRAQEVPVQAYVQLAQQIKGTSINSAKFLFSIHQPKTLPD